MMIIELMIFFFNIPYNRIQEIAIANASHASIHLILRAQTIKKTNNYHIEFRSLIFAMHDTKS